MDVDVNEGFRKQMPQIENENIIWCDVTHIHNDKYTVANSWSEEKLT